MQLPTEAEINQANLQAITRLNHLFSTETQHAIMSGCGVVTNEAADAMITDIKAGDVAEQLKTNAIKGIEHFRGKAVLSITKTQ